MKIEQVSKEDMIRLKAYFTQKYGIELDEWFSAVMHEMNQLNQESKLEIGKATEEIKTAAKLLNGQMHAVHFKDNKQAFWFGFGKYLPFSVPMLLIVSFIAYFQFTSRAFEDKRAFIKQYPNTASFRMFLINAKIEKIGESHYVPLKLKPKTGDISIGTEYMYDKQNERVLIPLGRE